ncbi:hypothetical protein pipiens_000790, partial [Culex pipiens pipiens]
MADSAYSTLKLMKGKVIS